mgnify:CR=1 FL=1
MNTPEHSQLGKVSAYVDRYDASLLFPLPRETKRREIGILTALGTRAWQIIAIFVTQAGFVAVLGVIGGIIGGFAVLSVRNAFREWLASAFNLDLFPQDIYFLSEIPAYTDFADLSIICTTAVVLCLIAAVIPSFFAARVDPAVALRD